MKHFRKEKMESELQKIISNIIVNEVKDPRLGFTTLLRVEISPDFRNAKVFISVYGDPKKIDETVSILNKARGFIQSRLPAELKLRYIPELKFLSDRGAINVKEVDRIFDELQ